MKPTDSLPEPYEEVFIWWNNNGTIVRRVARLHAGRTYFQLSTYLADTKGQYLAPLDKVERWEKIVSGNAHDQLVAALKAAHSILPTGRELGMVEAALTAAGAA